MADRTNPLSDKPDWTAVWLANYSITGNVKAASVAAGVTRQAVYGRRDRDPEFASRWADALEDAIECLESVAWERAKAGSDLLIMFLLKGLNPVKYRDNPKVLVQTARMTDAELTAAVRLALAETNPGGTGNLRRIPAAGADAGDGTKQ